MEAGFVAVEVFDTVVFVVLFVAVEPVVGLGVVDGLAVGGLPRGLVNGALELLEVLGERVVGGFDNVGGFDVRVGLVAVADVDAVVVVDFLTVPGLELVVFAILLVVIFVFFSDFSFSFSFSFSSVGLLGGVKTPLDTDFVSVVLDSPDTDTFSC